MIAALMAILGPFLINILAVGAVVLFFNELKAFFWNILSWILTQLGSVIQLDEVSLEFKGWAAYMLQHLQIDNCLTAILAALLIRFTLSLIPGL